MKILHLADIHAREKDIEEIEKCLGFMLDNAVEENVDLAVIAGDCFDSRDIKLDSLSAKLIIKTVSELADQCPVLIVLGTPSHDGTAPEILNYAQGAHKIVVASNPDQINIRNEVIISLIPQPTKQFFHSQSGIAESNVEITQAMNGLFMGMGARASEYPDVPHILVGHWNVAGSKLSTGQVLVGHEIDIPYDSMMLADPDLICLGHIHLPQQIGDRAFYSGSLYSLNWGEMERKGFYIHTLDGKKLIESRFIETPTKKLVRFAFDQTSTDPGINMSFDESLEYISGAYVRIDITTWQDEASKINKEELSESLKRYGALDVDIRIIRVPRQTVRSESVLKVNTLRDKIKAMAELRGETVSESVLHKADLLEFGERKEQVAA
jgi:exonuclease SbcD